jgi:hypothetical protein
MAMAFWVAARLETDTLKLCKTHRQLLPARQCLQSNCFLKRCITHQPSTQLTELLVISTTDVPCCCL